MYTSYSIYNPVYKLSASYYWPLVYTSECVKDASAINSYTSDPVVGPVVSYNIGMTQLVTDSSDCKVHTASLTS